MSGYRLQRPAPAVAPNPVDIAFVTVNYNTLACVRELTGFFNALEAPFTFSFTVVDNNSKDRSREYLSAHPEIHSLQNGENLGYGRAVNRGVSATASEYVCVMNTDVTLNREALLALWQFMSDRPEAGVCAPRLTYEDGRTQGMIVLPSLLAHYVNWYARARARHWKQKMEQAREPLRVDGVAGGFFLIRRSVIPEPTLFDEDFFFYHEDVALVHELRNLGVPCFVVPGVSIIHTGGKSSSELSIAHFYKSKYLYVEKFFGPAHARAVHFLDRARILRKLAVYWLLRRLTNSETIKSKQRHYQVAWKAGW